MYLDRFDMLLDNLALLKELKECKLKLQSRPWLTLGLQKSISGKNKLHTNLINSKDSITIKEFYTNYKNYRNFLSKLTKKSKQAYSGFISENKAATVFKTR